MFTFTASKHCVARLVLAWYVLFVAVSVMASVAQPRSMEVVCSSMGVMKVIVQSGEAEPDQVMAMDCPLCAHTTPVLPPLPALTNSVTVVSALSHVLMPVSEAILVSLTAPPLPSRGPPVLN